MPVEPLPDEQACIARARRGSLDDFNRLVSHYQNAVFTTAYRMTGSAADADDVTQYTFITAYQKLDGFRGGSFRAWLTRIASNHVLDAMRQHKRRPVASLDAMSPADDPPPIPDDAPSPETIVLDRELQAAIQACIDALQADQRSAMVLCDIDGLDYAAIAAMTGVAVGTVKSRISRARAAMRDCLRGAQELLPAQFRL